MKKYPKYKFSGVEWIKEIPEEWVFTKLKFLTNLIVDGTHFTPEYIEEGIPFLRVTDIKGSCLDLTDIKKISVKEHKELSKRCNPMKGDLLLSKNGTIGRTIIVNWDYEFSIFVSLCLIRFKKTFDAKFADYVFKSNLFDQQINDNTKSVTVQNLHLEKIKEFEIVFPSLNEQHSIVRFLSYKTGQIDRFIATRLKQIELLKEQKSGIINKAVTKGINPTVKMKDSGIEWIGEIPEYWSISKVKFVSKVKGRIGFRGYTVSDLVEEGKGALTLGATQINKEGEIDLSKPVYISWEKYYESPEIMVEKDDILVVQRGSIGVVGIVNSDIGCATINPSLVVLKKVKMNKKLLFLQLRSKIVKEAIITIFNETAVPMLSQNQISNFNIILPSTPEEQQSIVNFIEIETFTIDTLIAKYQKQIDLMQEYRTSIISQAVTGKIDVREWEPKKKKYKTKELPITMVAEN